MAFSKSTSANTTKSKHTTFLKPVTLGRVIKVYVIFVPLNRTQNLLRTTGYEMTIKNYIQAYRKMRKRSENMGRPRKLFKKQVQDLVVASENPVRDQPLPAQSQYHSVGVSERTLQPNLATNALNRAL